MPFTGKFVYIYISGQIVLLPEETTLIIFKQNQFIEKNLVESDDIIISSNSISSIYKFDFE